MQKLKKKKGKKLAHKRVLNDSRPQFDMRSPIRIGAEKRNASQSVNAVKPPPNLSGLRIAPQSFLSQVGQKNNLHSTSNKMHNIYKQPLAGMKGPKSQRNGHKIQNF